MQHQWSGLTWDAMVTGIDAGSPLGLRMLKLSAGGAVAAAEAQRMSAEAGPADAGPDRSAAPGAVAG